MNHVEFLEIGLSIDCENAGEVTIRNSLGRIYYYVYHELLEFVMVDESLAKIFSDLKEKIPSCHKRLAVVFAEAAKGTQNLKFGKISRLLGVLHRLRCQADYELDTNLNKDSYLSMIAQLDDLKNVAQEINPNSFDTDVLPKNIIITGTTINSASIQVIRRNQPDRLKKKPSLRILD